MDKLIGLQRYTLCRLEQVKSALNPNYIDAADSIIARYDDDGVITDYEFDIASDFVLMALSKMEERDEQNKG